MNTQEKKIISLKELNVHIDVTKMIKQEEEVKEPVEVSAPQKSKVEVSQEENYLGLFLFRYSHELIPTKKMLKTKIKAGGSSIYTIFST